MYGARVVDSITNIPGRKQYDAHPYGKVGTSALSIVTCTDKEGNRYVAMGEKGDRVELVPPGGYIQPHPPGADTSNNVAAYDNTIPDVGRREVREETGLNLDNVPAAYVGEPYHIYGKSDDPRLQNTVHFLLYDLGQRDPLPELKEGANRNDLKNPRWINVSQIESTLDLSVDKYEQVKTTGEIRIHPLHATYINQAIQMVREQEINPLKPAAPAVHLGSLATTAHIAKLAAQKSVGHQ